MSTVKIDAPTAPKPVGLYPHARRAGNLLFLSGIGPRDPQSDGVPGLSRSPAGGESGCRFAAPNVGNSRLRASLEEFKSMPPLKSNTRDQFFMDKFERVKFWGRAGSFAVAYFCGCH